MDKKETMKALVDIVSYPNHIKAYSTNRDDYTELAVSALNNNPSTIRHIPATYKDYALLCAKAVSLDPCVFGLIDDSVENYKELGIQAIYAKPYVVLTIRKDKKHYIDFWKFAIAQCYEILRDIDRSRPELFTLLRLAIAHEPLAICFVDSRIPIYNELCDMAYVGNPESVKYMNLNEVDEALLLAILEDDPDKIRYLDRNNAHYHEACSFVVNIKGSLIRHVSVSEYGDNLDEFFELVDLAEEKNPQVRSYPNVIYALITDNRNKRSELDENPESSIGISAEELDEEYERLTTKYLRALRDGEQVKYSPESAYTKENCPIKCLRNK